MSTRDRFGMSWWNAAFAAAIVVAGVLALVFRQWAVAAVFGVVLVAFVVGVRYARSGRASDVTRLNAAEYTDERDRRMAAYGLAIVGVVAMALSMGTFVAALVLLPPGHPMYFVAWGQLVALALAWMVANWIAARRH